MYVEHSFACLCIRASVGFHCLNFYWESLLAEYKLFAVGCLLRAISLSYNSDVCVPTRTYDAKRHILQAGVDNAIRKCQQCRPVCWVGFNQFV